MEALHDPEWAVRRQAAPALGQIKPSLSTVEDALKECERDPHTAVRKAAQQSLATLRELSANGSN